MEQHRSIGKHSKLIPTLCFVALESQKQAHLVVIAATMRLNSLISYVVTRIAAISIETIQKPKSQKYILSFLSRCCVKRDQTK